MHSFYLVSQVERNAGFGLKFFQGKNMFATMSNKSFNRETSQHLISYNTIDNTIQSLPTVRAVIKANEYPSGKYYVQEFFNETRANEYLSITVIQYKWPAIVEIYFTISGNLLDPYSLKVCNFRFTFFKKGYEKDIEGQVGRRCPRLFESSFYLVSKIEGNNDVGLKFFYNGSEFAII
ncbi:hypothetical protein F8M41_006083 [Gigaspora margarita]|uniref:Uncharacterized protein n=1 Tax=Gigaspora margarita TaxID=4874 RepID=A0A8H3XA09_GIGMA|nr:hypothetical protein F8M41_006083 [Gigaspora margarita]